MVEKKNEIILKTLFAKLSWNKSLMTILASRVSIPGSQTFSSLEIPGISIFLEDEFFYLIAELCDCIIKTLKNNRYSLQSREFAVSREIYKREFPDFGLSF